MVKIKLVTIGAGSSYTPELVEGIIKRYDDFPVNEWWLVDVEEGREKTEIVAELARRQVSEANIDIKIITSYNRKEALKDADYVTTQFRVGMLEAREKDEYIPLTNGLLGQETNGAGGLFKGLRTMPVILEIINDVKKYAKPNAWIVNFTNPVAMNTELVVQLTDYKRFIGVCNVAIHMGYEISKLMNVKIEQLKMDVVGLNHLSYFNNFYIDDNDKTEQIINRILDEEKSIAMNNTTNIPFDPEFIRQLGAMPNSYLRYYYKRDAMLKEYLKESDAKNVRATVVRKLEASLFEKYKDPNLKEKPIELSKRGGAHYSDIACGVLKALHTNSGKEFVINTRNDGLISNLPKEWAVEVTAKITNNGPVSTGRKMEVPLGGLPLIETMKRIEQLAIMAVKERKIAKAYLALAINPLSYDDISAKKTFVELVEAHKKDLIKYYDDIEEVLKWKY